MNILILNEEFLYDTHGYLITDIASKLISEGHKIYFYAAKSKYSSDDIPHNEYFTIKNQSIKLKRFWVFRSLSNLKIIKILNSIIYCIQCLISGLFLKKIDIIICASSHILFLGNVALILSKVLRAKFIYRVEDIHPHQYDFNLKNFFGRLGFKIFNTLEKLNYHNANIIQVISRDMKETIEERSDKDIKIRVIPNIPRGVIKKEINYSDKILKKEEGTFRMIFAGNIGKFQALETIIDSIFFLKNNKFQFIIIGDGVKKNDLKKRAKELLNKNIFFLDHMDIFKVNDFISSSDLGVVSLKNGIEKLAFPSKITSYLEFNCPLLVLANEKSELSDITKHYDIGIVQNYSSPKDLSKKLISCIETKNFKVSYEDNINIAMNSYFSKKNILDKWLKVIDDI